MPRPKQGHSNNANRWAGTWYNSLKRKITMAQFPRLSNREWDVLKLLLQGKSNKLIASSLGISDRTVEFHLKNIYAKFQVNSRIELILKLVNATGWLESEKLGLSAVDSKVEIVENRDRHNPWMGWATSFRETVSIIRKELEMKTFLASWFFWIIANTIGAATGLAITLATIYIIGFDKDSAISLVLVIATAICIGASQWLIVRKYATRTVLWLVASVFGVLLGAIAIAIYYPQLERESRQSEPRLQPNLVVFSIRAR